MTDRAVKLLRERAFELQRSIASSRTSIASWTGELSEISAALNILEMDIAPTPISLAELERAADNAAGDLTVKPVSREATKALRGAALNDPAPGPANERVYRSTGASEIAEAARAADNATSAPVNPPLIHIASNDGFNTLQDRWMKFGMPERFTVEVESWRWRTKPAEEARGTWRR